MLNVHFHRPNGSSKNSPRTRWKMQSALRSKARSSVCDTMGMSSEAVSWMVSWRDQLDVQLVMIEFLMFS